MEIKPHYSRAAFEFNFRPLIGALVVAATAATLTACGGGGAVPTSPTTNAGGNASGQQSISGIAATGAALSNTLIHALNNAGEEFTSQSGPDGSFVLSVSGQGPFLLYADSPSGRLYGFASSAGAANINQITDTIVRSAKPADALSAQEGGFDLVSSIQGAGIYPAIEQQSGPDGVPGTADDLVLIKGIENRKLLGCVAAPTSSSSAADRQAYQDYLNNSTTGIPMADFVSCFTANQADYMKAVYSNYVDLTWKRRAADYASNMAGAKASVIANLGLQRVRDLTSSTDAVDLSTFDPMTSRFTAGSGRGFDGLLDRIQLGKQCDSNTNQCTSSITFFADTAKTIPSGLPEVAIGRASSTAPSYCKEGNEALRPPLTTPLYAGAASGQWALEITSTSVMASPLGTTVTMPNMICPAATKTLKYVSGATNNASSYTPLAAATTRAEMQANQVLTCSDFTVGQVPSATYAIINFLGNTEFMSLASLGRVQSCSITSNDAEGVDGAFGIKVSFASKIFEITYHKVP